MIIDADTHISPTGEDAMAITYGELLRRMDHAGVDKALTWLRPPYMREIAESNAYVYEATQQYPDRILGFGWARACLGKAAPGGGMILSFGGGVSPGTPPDNVDALLRAAREWSKCNERERR
jgi:hypothetical protein